MLQSDNGGKKKGRDGHRANHGAHGEKWRGFSVGRVVPGFSLRRLFVLVYPPVSRILMSRLTRGLDS